jgi:16S rRNA (cytidine1402-2'-O)-methyltransferase
MARPPLESQPRKTAEPSDTRDAEQSRFRGIAIIATPIGNAGDITLRALDTLRSADAILCEDTRVSAKLLTRHGIRRPLIAYHEHNAARMRPQILERLRRGEALALISDAGQPLVSDPGFKLVRAALAENLPVTALPGPSAAMTALVLSGLPTDRFFFAGFLSPKTAQRRRELGELLAVPGSLIFFESAQRLPATLADIVAVFGARPAAVARELTKLFEEVRRGELGELAAHYATAGAPLGEVTIVVGPPAERVQPSLTALDDALGAALAEHSLRDAVDLVSARLGLARRQVYARALELAQGEP